MDQRTAAPAAARISMVRRMMGDGRINWLPGRRREGGGWSEAIEGVDGSSRVNVEERR